RALRSPAVRRGTKQKRRGSRSPGQQVVPAAHRKNDGHGSVPTSGGARRTSCSGGRGTCRSRDSGERRVLDHRSSSRQHASAAPRFSPGKTGERCPNTTDSKNSIDPFRMRKPTLVDRIEYTAFATALAGAGRLSRKSAESWGARLGRFGYHGPRI